MNFTFCCDCADSFVSRSPPKDQVGSWNMPKRMNKDDVTGASSSFEKQSKL